MARFAAKISIEDFKEKLRKAIESHSEFESFHPALSIYNISLILSVNSKINKDLSKIEFSTENIEFEAEKPDFDPNFIGFQQLSNGLTFLGIQAGGDWESWLAFIVYWDGKQFRGYIPGNGNNYNKNTKQAYGNDETEDAKFGYSSETIIHNTFDVDVPVMIKDIENRIKVK